MKTRISYILFLVSILGYSCKEVDEFIPVFDGTPFEFGQEFTNAQDTLTYQLNLVEPMIITTPRGTEFVFKPEMFEYQNGDFCRCEKVTIEIIELDKKRDYMVHQASTISNNQILISAGAYHLAAYSEGKPLRLTRGHLVCFWLPSDQLDPEMKLFFGERAGNGFNWTLAELSTSGSSITPGEWQYNDSTSLIVGYQCFSDRLEWINVDKFVKEEPKNPVCVKSDPLSTGENTVIFALLTEYNAILQLNFSASDGFCLANVPVGAEVLFVGVRKSGNGLYEFASETSVIEQNHFQSLDFTPKNFDEIKNILSGL